MKLVYKICFKVITFLKHAFSAYKDYCCRKAKSKRKIKYFKEAIMRAEISLAKTEMQARALGYTHEEWEEYQKSIQPKESEVSDENLLPEEGETNV